MSEVNMNDKSKVINLCSYPVSWKRMTIIGDEYIKGNASAYILNSELDTQKNNGNKSIAGTDGLGSHAEVCVCYRQFDTFEESVSMDICYN